MGRLTQSQVTQLLAKMGEGDPQALSQLMPLIYAEMKGIALRALRRDRRGHTLQPTALVNEAYLRLVDQRHANWGHRSNFFHIAAQIMRRILVDHARARAARKRGGLSVRVPLADDLQLGEAPSLDLLALDEALTALAAIDERQVRIVELRFFGGHSIEETADLLDISPATVKREWIVAKSWLRCEMKGGGS